MGAALAAKRIESIDAHTQPDIPWIVPKFWVLDVQCLPLASIYRVSQYLVCLIIIGIILLASSFPRASA
jgi:hypothetical protein